MPFNTNDESACDDAGQRKEFEFRPPSGTTTVRILPTWKGSDAPAPRYFWREFREHYLKVGDQTWVFPSPREFGQPDPLWDKAEELFAKKDPALAEVADDLVPGRKYLFNVVVLNCPAYEQAPEIGKATVMKVGKTVWEPINKLNSNRSSQFHTITMPENGVNLDITREGTALKTRYTVLPNGGRSDLFADLAARGIQVEPEALSGDVVDLDEYLNAKALRPDQVASVLAQYLRINGVEVAPEVVVPAAQVPDVVQAPAAPPVVATAPPVAPTVAAPAPPVVATASAPATPTAPPVTEGLAPPPPPFQEDTNG